MSTATGRDRIVAGVDGSEPSARALRWAVVQARLTGADVEAVTAWDFPLGYGLGPVVADPADLARAAEKVLCQTVAAVVGEHPPVTVRGRIVQGHPAYVLIQASREAQLLVVGSRGHGGFVGALLGSVSQYCAHHAPCPVVIVRG